MIRLYSKGCEYAVRALMYVEENGETKRFQAKEVCARAGIPEAFTRKVFQALVQAGFLKAVRGPGGGYLLTKNPQDISLLEIMKAVDGETRYDYCVMGLDACDSANPCPLHDMWAGAKAELLATLQAKTLRDLIDTSTQRQKSAKASKRKRKKA